MSSHFNSSKRLSNGFPSYSTNGATEEMPISSYNWGQPNGASRHIQRQSVNLDELRGGLARRNTTNNQPFSYGLPQAGQQQRSAAERPSSGQFSFPTIRSTDSSQVIERKQHEYEVLKEKQARFKAEMQALEQQEELLRRDLYGGDRQSEPTTPPEYQDNGFPTMFSRPNRFSSSSVISPPSLNNTTRSSRAGSQVISPSERDRTLQALTGFAGQSMPGSRGDSDEEEQHDRYSGEVLNFDHKKAAALNRNSMPVTRRDHGTRNGAPDPAFDHLDTTSFLFDDDNKSSDQNTPVARQFPAGLQMHTNSDNFPTLRPIGRQAEASNGSNALDLANSRTMATDPNAGGWPSFNRQSMPPPTHHSTSDSMSSALPPPSSSGNTTPSTSGSVNRHSMGPRIGPPHETKRPGLISSPPSSSTTKSSSSFSTSSVPTMASINTSNGNPAKANVNTTAEQRLHQHNMSLGRIPTSAVNSNRQSREFPSPETSRAEENVNNMASLSSMLQGSAMPFGPGSNHISSPEPQNVSVHQNFNAFNNNSTQSNFNANIDTSGGAAGQTAFNGYGMTNHNTLNTLMGNLHLQNQAQYNQPQGYSQNVGYNPFQQMPTQRLPDNQTRVMQQRRNQNGEDASRFGNIELEQLQGEIYSLCKDQHGCRFLQKRLEERKPDNVELIFRETYEHMVELMTDPFGNYLCQKLLEYANEEQRTVLIDYASPDMVTIALNQHGTRALQKMIEFVSTSIQIQAVTRALEDHVVRMIQDLNGNHVIQKCLNRLSSEHIQFIVDAVSRNCVTVGTHRHGCCVIQRCVDHADGIQKSQLVSSITNCSLELVKDPFGNYVLQYIFDLDQEAFSQPLCETFLGAIAPLAKQKFSSNVIEKCLRVADDNTKHAIIQEILTTPDFERLVDDNYANYVLQTALEQGTPEDENQLVERIRPMLPRLRHKPHGRRYQTKINERDRRLGIATSGSITPSEMSSPDSSAYSTPYNRNLGHDTQQAYHSLNGGGYGPSTFASPMYQYQPAAYGYGMGPPPRMNNPPFNPYNQYPQGNVQQTFSPFGRAHQNGGSYY